MQYIFNKSSSFLISKIFLISFLLNFIWENAHSILYVSNTIGIDNHILLMIYASVVDAFFISITFMVLTAINNQRRWSMNLKNIFLFSCILLLVSLFMEHRALLSDRWVYSDAMPLIFGIGVSPLFQLVISGVLSLFLIGMKFEK